MELSKLQTVLKKGGVNPININIYAPILYKYFTQEKFTDEDCYRFLANACNETGCFSKNRESLYYTTERLKNTFKSAFVTGGYNYVNYLKNEQKLANLVYDSRKGFSNSKNLGNNQDGDGYKFRGAGFFQTTGRAQFELLKKATGMDVVNHPELLEFPENAVKSAVEYWKYNKLGLKPSLKEVRRSIGGSLFGLEEVTEYYNKLKS